MHRKSLRLLGISGLTGLVVASVVAFNLVHAQKSSASSQIAMKQKIIATDISHHNQTGGASYIRGSIPGPKGTGPQTVPKPQLAQNMPVPDSLTMTYHLSSTAYTDQIHVAVLSGNTIASPTTGVVIIEYYQKNLQAVAKTIPNAGQVTIMSFSGHKISLHGSLGGHGVYNLTTNTLSWRN